MRLKTLKIEGYSMRIKRLKKNRINVRNKVRNIKLFRFCTNLCLIHLISIR
jgi:hypothetical protein